MRLYEINIESLWWVAAEDEMDAMSILRAELFNREVSEEEMDSVMDDLTIMELPKEEAETISLVDDYEGSAADVDSLWTLFEATHTPGLVYTDYLNVEEFEDGFYSTEEIDYGVDGTMPGDWY